MSIHKSDGKNSRSYAVEGNRLTPDRWRRINELFQSALDEPPETREAMLVRESSGDLALQLRVKNMLRDHARHEGLLDSAPWRPGVAKLSSFQPGQVVAERYEIVRLVAKGGMGEVYEAKDMDLNDAVALKTLLPEIAANEQMVMRFKREIQLSRKIAHPNVCKIFDLTRHPGGVPAASQTLFLTMEFLPGETLLDLMEREGVLSMQRALPILTQVADGMEAAHRAGVVHRDLKASNIMLVPAMDGGVRAVVTDFGLARRVTAKEGEGRITETGKLLGTWDYMAPELLEGRPPSPASDIYSLGILAYIVVTGNRPFPKDSPIEAIIRRSRDPVPPPSLAVEGLEAHWDAAILGCLDADPSRRFQRPAEFATTLINWTD